MDKEEELYNEIAQKILKEKRLVKMGKMMSSPGISYKKKFFAFYYKKEITIKLGENFDPRKYGVKKLKHLNPFKNKAAMKNWYQFPYSENKNWEKLSRLGLEFVIGELKKK